MCESDFVDRRLFNQSIEIFKLFEKFFLIVSNRLTSKIKKEYYFIINFPKNRNSKFNRNEIIKLIIFSKIEARGLFEIRII